MALANFFHKDALALSQILKDQNASTFKKILSAHIVSVAFDKKATFCDEGKSLIDLTVRLLARLYPNIQIKNLDETNCETVDSLKELAQAINPDINIVENKTPSVVLVVGETKYDIEDIPVFYVGSSNWNVFFSDQSPVNIGQSQNPFGAGAAACFGAANIFRFVFGNELQNSSLDTSFNLSLKSFTKENGSFEQDFLSEVDLGEVQLVGIGAIGNGAIWALSKLSSLKGRIHLIDDEKVSLSNLQRYVLCEQSDVGTEKVHVGSNYFRQKDLKVYPHFTEWKNYLKKRGNWKLSQVAVCVDSAEDRIKIQGALPKSIINAYTDIKILGISRHFDFLDHPCLACAYMPVEKRKSHSMKVAESLNLSNNEKFIREYLYHKKPVDQQMLDLIGKANEIDIAEISQYKGSLLEEFYAEVVCGGILMEISGSKQTNEQFEAPLVFQSTLAGILLASELFIHAGNLRKETLPSSTQINMLSPLDKYQPQHFDVIKNNHGNCICGDKDFQKAYRTKWVN